MAESWLEGSGKNCGLRLWGKKSSLLWKVSCGWLKGWVEGFDKNRI
jgi:hypothetical protein